MSETKRRVIIVGSGFGGAVAACRLSQAGFEVVILERGRRFKASDFPPLPDREALLPDFARWLWNGDRGLWDIDDLGEVVSVQAAGYGGGSLIYANVHLRPPMTVFDERWPIAYQGGGELTHYYDLAGFMLDAAPLENLSPKAVALQQFAERGHTFFRPPLAINYRAKTHLGLERPTCEMCARCSTGCPTGAKNTLDWNYLAIAERRGARVFTQCEVRELRRSGDAWEVTYFDHILQEPGTLSAPYVFLCAGAVNSTRLLAKLNATDTSVPKIPYVGIGYHPNADAIAMVYDTKQDLEPANGPTIGGSLVNWIPPKGAANDANDQLKPPKEFFLVQDGGYAQELDRLLGLFRAGFWLNRNRHSRAAPRDKASSVSQTEAVPNAAQTSARAAPLVSPLDAARAVIIATWSGQLRASTADLLRQWSSPWLRSVVAATVDAAVTTDTGPGRSSLKRRLARMFVGPTERIADIAFDRLFPLGERLLHERFHQMIGYVSGAAKRRWMLLTMGSDATPGVLHYDAKNDRLFADLDLFHLLPMYQRQESLLAQLAAAAGGEMRTNPAWTFLGKPYTVHGQGGCRMSDDDDEAGPTTPECAVRHANNLYVLDGSVLCTSVGVNPSATITAIAERNILKFIQRQKHLENWPHGPEFVSDEGASEYKRHVEGAAAWTAKATEEKWDLTPPYGKSAKLEERKLGVKFKEALRGQIMLASDALTQQHSKELLEANAADDAYRARKAFREFEAKADATYVDLDLMISIPNLARFVEDQDHEAEVTGQIGTSLPGSAHGTYDIEWGRMRTFVPRYKPYALQADKDKVAFHRATGRPYLSLLQSRAANLNGTDERARLMVYELWFRSKLNSELWVVQGVKRLRQDPGLDLWDDTTSLYVTLRGPCDQRVIPVDAAVRAAGVIHIGPLGFLENQRRITVTGDDVDLARKAWAIAKFHQFFYGSLKQIYAPRAAEMVDSFFGVQGTANGN